MWSRDAGSFLSAGRPDPIDASAFRIDYALDGRAGTAPRPPLRRRRWIARAAILAAVLVALMVAAVRYGPEIERRWDVLASQRAFLEYQSPPETILFSQSADDTFDTQPGLAGMRANPVPMAWHRFDDRHLQPSFNGGVQGQQLIFLHERTSPSSAGFRMMTPSPSKVCPPSRGGHRWTREAMAGHLTGVRPARARVSR